MSHVLNSEVFLIPDESQENNYLVFAPLRNAVVRATGEQVNLLAKLKQGLDDVEPWAQDLLADLTSAGLVNGPPEELPATFEGADYAPTRGTLLISNRCNLACTYCYADSGTHGAVMDLDLAKAAVDFVIGNCLARERKTVDLGFHGGGEPTLAWDTLTGVVDYARAKAYGVGLQLNTGIATNGCMADSRAEWLAQNMSHVTLSLDGPPEIQDRQRPLRNGGASSEQLTRTVRILEKHNIPYSFQATVTSENTGAIPDIVAYIGETFRPQQLKIEPVTNAGRNRCDGKGIPDGLEFAAHYLEAQDVADRYRLSLMFSGVRLEGTRLSHFCGAFGEPFAVTPDGLVTACYEAFCSDTEYASVFVIGQFDPTTRAFEIDREKLEGLRKRTIYNLPACRNCFCKYSCAGGCATRAFRWSGEYDLYGVGGLCQAIRMITRRHLAAIADGTAKRVRNCCHG